MKSIEDDPTITPGSVVRSPLSLATIKDTEIFSAQPPSTVPSKASPPVEPLSISSSTWSFNPISTTSFTRYVIFCHASLVIKMKLNNFFFLVL